MKKTEIEEGVVAEYKGKYWGQQTYEENYGDIFSAFVRNPKYCKTPTDMTHPVRNGDKHLTYEMLEKAKLVKVKRRITIEFEIE